MKSRTIDRLELAHQGKPALMVNWEEFPERSTVDALMIPSFGQFWFRQLEEVCAYRKVILTLGRQRC